MLEIQNDLGRVGAISYDRFFLVELERINRLLAVPAAVARRAGCKYLDKGKSSAPKGFLDRLGEIPSVKYGPACNIAGSRSVGQQGQIEGLLGVAKGRCRRNGETGGRRRGLSASHSVIEVVDADHRQIHIAPGGMKEVISTYGEKVPVAAEYDHRQFRVGKLHPRGKRDSAPMCSVIGVELDVSSASSRTPYS